MLGYTGNSMSDFYAVLNVERTADAREIKTAYRKLALRYHPDRNPGDTDAEERFKQINEAYAVLSDAEKRSRYDRFGTADAAGVGFQGDIFDIFSSVFGAGFAGGGAQVQRGVDGEDLEAQLTISLEQAREGSTVPLDVERYTTCDRCKGDRAEPGKDGRRTCPTCAGAGQVRQQAQSLFGTVMTARTCPQCRGIGDLITDPCSNCSGRGRVRERAAVDVSLPRGIDGGYRLRIPREGNVGLDGGQTGDLYVYLELEPHPYLARDGDDIHFDLKVGFAQAALGAAFEVPTLDGMDAIEIPPGTQPGAEFRLRGKGMPRLRSIGTGDQIVRVRVEVPSDLSDRAREILRAYAEEMGEALEEKTTLGERIKGFFRKRQAAKDEKTDRHATEA